MMMVMTMMTVNLHLESRLWKLAQFVK